ncbi:RmlC-like cupin domain-containing protein [Phialemonium atrogriseum]|uniref:RmlC-like cupin domain-containing protein n=1 Tax=Phialemonium atrogriseum TaxID=1093897 RepID=A0AAJ0FRI4_9PEZI|nr:RmlC-like cupin domain-containing protein [Phialemonium atrogriseum]KAK1772318.1 RmlC-like cupin domain-containing protein [Phialemonium atrogriseum]
MKSLSLLISIIIGIASIVLLRERITDLTSYTASILLNKIRNTPAISTTTDTGAKDTPQLQSSVLDLPPNTHLTATNMSIPRAIRKVFLAVEQAEGAGARVRRSIGTPQLRNFSPFLMLDHFSIKPGAGFPDHPHRGQETITYLLTGGVDHEDFAGNKGTIEAGDLQFMTAGRGIMHAEMPRQNPDGSANVGLQLWVDLPQALKKCEPRYRDLRAAEIPSVDVDDGRVHVKVISGQSHGVDSVQDLAYTPVWILDVEIKPGGKIVQPLPEGWSAFAYTLDGQTLFGKAGNQTAVDQYHNVVFEPKGEVVHAEVDAGAAGSARFVLVAGTPLDQEVVQYGPFVLNSKEEVYQALEDYRSHSNGFERAKDWESEIGKSMVR